MGYPYTSNGLGLRYNDDLDGCADQRVTAYERKHQACWTIISLRPTWNAFRTAVGGLGMGHVGAVGRLYRDFSVGFGPSYILFSYMTFKTASIPSARRFRISDLLRRADYMSALLMMTVPTIDMRYQAPFICELQRSGILIVYLKDIGMVEDIGLLAGSHSLLGAVGALMLTLAPRIKSVERQLYLFLITLAIAVILISITPLLLDFWPLFAAIALRGLMLGFNQPLMISVMASASPPETQGQTVGLRTTANRAASTIIPVAMGLMIEAIGLHLSFYLMGVLMMAACLWIWILIIRASKAGNLGH